MNIKTMGKLLALSAGGLAGAATGAAADEGVKGLPAEVYDCKRITAENLVEPPPPLFDVKDAKSYPAAEERFAEENKLAEAPCPAGRIAYPTGDEFPSLAPHPKGFDPTGSTKTQYRDLWDPTRGYFRYVSREFNVVSQGASVEMTIGDPQIESTYGLNHSIAEIFVYGEANSKYSVEFGWRSNRWQNGPRLFTFVNKDNYSSYGLPNGDCYNCHFVPFPGAEYVPGQALVPSETNTETIRFGTAIVDGNWWIWVGDQWIGYLDREFWPNRTDESIVHTMYGEVADQATGQTDMGNGIFGHNSAAAIMKDPETTHYKNGEWTKVDQPTSTAVGNPLFVTNESWYDGWDSGGEMSRYWKYGGPGSA